MSGLELTLFGSPQVVRDGVPITFDTRKAVAMLSFLAVTGSHHRRESLAALFWPGAPTPKARATLRRTLSVASAVGPALRLQGSDVWLDSDLCECDVVRFRREAEGAGPEQWAAAAALARAPFLEGFSLRDSPTFDDWVEATGDALRDETATVLGRLASDALGAGDLAGAVAHSQRRVALDPLSEPAVVELMQALSWSGDRTGALRHYRTLVRLLDRELGIDPLPETQEVAAAIRGDRFQQPTASSRAEARPTASPTASDRLVGRQSEQATITAAWRSVAGGPGIGQVVGIRGETGAGRSALLRDAARLAAAEGGVVLGITGRAAERHVGYAAAADLLAPLLTDGALSSALPNGVAEALRPLGGVGPSASGPSPLGPPPYGQAAFDSLTAGSAGPPGSRPGPPGGGEGSRRLLFDAARALIAARAVDTPVLLAIDDAHLVDESSQDLLAYVLRRLPRRVMAAVTWPVHGGREPLPLACRDAPGAIPVQLEPLALDAVAGLLADLGAQSSYPLPDVMARSGGLPQLIVELVASDLAEGSTPVQQVVEARVAAASPLTVQMLAASAVLGIPADVETLRSVSGRDDAEVVDGVEEALQRGLLVERGGGFDLPHDLARRAVLTTTSPVRLRLLHRRAGAHLTRRQADRPGVIAEHFGASGDSEQAAAWHLVAGQAAAAIGASAERLHHLNQTLLHDPDAPGVQLALGDTLVLLGRYQDALLAYERAGAESADDPGSAAALEHRIAVVHDRRGEAHLARAHLHSARTLLARGGQRALLSRVTSESALLATRVGELTEARELAEAALTLAREGLDEAAIARAQTVVGLVAVRMGELDRALDVLGEAVASGRRSADPPALLAALNGWARALLEAGRGDDSLAAASEALTIANKIGDAHLVGVIHSAVADALHELGRDAQAETHLAQSASALAEIEGQRERPGIWLLELW